MKTINIKSQTRFSIRLRKVLRRLLAFLFGIAGIALIVYLDARLRSNTSLPELSLDMSSGLLFVVGFLTGFHCVGMCGALVLGYATKSAATGKLRYSGHLLYGLGKTISYTVMGAGSA